MVLLALAATLASGDSAQGYDNPSKPRHFGSRSSLGRLYSSSSEPLRRSVETSGCGMEHIEGYSSSKDHHSLYSGGVVRYYAMEVPSGYNHDKTRPWRLISDFYSASRTSKDQYNNSRYFAATGGEKYVIVYSQGRGNVWEGAEYSIEGVNDLGFIADLLNHLESSYCIDKNRIYVSGKSNSGGLVDMLGKHTR
jgi:poly(3-hydroxybutyrate) depolymerase